MEKVKSNTVLQSATKNLKRKKRPDDKSEKSEKPEKSVRKTKIRHLETMEDSSQEHPSVDIKLEPGVEDENNDNPIDNVSIPVEDSIEKGVDREAKNDSVVVVGDESEPEPEPEPESSTSHLVGNGSNGYTLPEIGSEASVNYSNFLDFMYPDRPKTACLFVCMDHDIEDMVLGSSTLIVSEDWGGAKRLLDQYLFGQSLRNSTEKPFTLVPIYLNQKGAYLVSVTYQNMLQSVSTSFSKKLTKGSSASDPILIRESDDVTNHSTSISKSKQSVFICKNIMETIPMRCGAVVIAANMTEAKKLLTSTMKDLNLIRPNEKPDVEYEKLDPNAFMPSGRIISLYD